MGCCRSGRPSDLGFFCDLSAFGLRPAARSRLCSWYWVGRAG